MPSINGKDGDEYLAISIREARPWTESRAKKPRRRKNAPEPARRKREIA